ncbi:MAG: 2-oxo acid dehydrogenase subunit E2 [Leptospiraceae bacterium]|nr:2-oxo acid dehydrogenase subunit E2 [Leptospiraceae bacterium]
MATEVRVPELGENIETADVTAVLVEKGDQVQADQPLIEVESDKASLEIPAPAAGTVEEIRIKAGQKIRVGQVILTLGGADAAASKSTEEKAESKEPEKAPAQKEKASESAGPAKASTERASKPADTSEGAFPTGRAPGPASVSATPAETGMPAPASPSVRRLARELGVDINRVQGHGPGGRISMQDVKDHVKGLVQRRGGAAVAGAQPELPDFERFGKTRREPMSGVRRKIADKMSLSWTSIPHVTQFDESDITELEAFRKQKGKLAEKAGGKLTVTAILLKVLAQALRRFPNFNASLDMDHDEIVFKEYVNIGVAVDTDHGLLVPVIRNVDQKGVIEISVELDGIAGRARERKIKPDELQGSNISLTNLGGLGTTYFTPIINWPDVAVLGVGRAKIQAVHRNGAFEPRLMLPLSISYDHRIIDGADAARFLRWIAEVLEQPLHMLL